MTKLNAQQIDALNNYSVALQTSISARAAYEKAQNTDNDNIQKTLSNLAKDFSHEAVVSVMHTANVNADFINRHERKNKRFNVYAAQKVANIARSAAQADTLNNYTRCVFLTALKLTKEKLSMTHADAQASLCSDLRCDAHKSAHIVRYARSIAASTADTQSSSSINALQMFDVLKETRDDKNEVAYTLNKDAPTTKRLAKALSVAL
ncbi:hypothetical protein [Methylorubrum extorquens]|uniref:hypothetical protein n=1 Tax=Methylorubrum extorquens TaxID=408 RepID=UPI00209ED298|nr:hypothetical protein [Methylorubrum extorquens]MCP1540091.1 hypothetical protein [Methylorubrum extorquens]